MGVALGAFDGAEASRDLSVELPGPEIALGLLFVMGVARSFMNRNLSECLAWQVKLSHDRFAWKPSSTDGSSGWRPSGGRAFRRSSGPRGARRRSETNADSVSRRHSRLRPVCRTCRWTVTKCGESTRVYLVDTSVLTRLRKRGVTATLLALEDVRYSPISGLEYRFSAGEEVELRTDPATG